MNSLFIAKARKEVLERSQYGCSCNKTQIINGDLYTKAYCDWDESTPVCTTPTYSEQQCQYKHKRETRDDDEIDAPLDYVIFKPAPPQVCIWITVIYEIV